MKPISKYRIFFFLCILWVLMLGACGPKLPSLQKMAPLPAGGVCRIAVLPFTNATDNIDGGLKFYRVFMSELINYENFEVVQEGDVRGVSRQMRLNPGFQSPTNEQVQLLGNFLNVDILVIGHIVDMGERVINDIATPYLSVNMQLVNAKSGKTLWYTYHNREGEQYRKVMHFGMVNTATSLSRRISQEILELWFSEGFITSCTD